MSPGAYNSHSARRPLGSRACHRPAVPSCHPSVAVSPARIRALNDAPINRDGTFVLYWMVAHRRAHSNYALQRAVEWALERHRPLVVLEALAVDYPWASARLHRFVLDGMADNVVAFGKSSATYYPYVEPSPDAARGLIETWARHATVVVTDDFPCFFLPAMVNAAGRRLRVKAEAVDANGVLPMRAAPKAFYSAYLFRRYLQSRIAEELASSPLGDPLSLLPASGAAPLPEVLTSRWPRVPRAMLAGDASTLAALPIDHDVSVAPHRGGRTEALRRLEAFARDRLATYPRDRNEPSLQGTSALSPYLHFGHISAHEIFARVAQGEGWRLDRLSGRVTGQREGFWGMSPPAEAFLDQLIVWRELGYNMCALRDDYDRYESLPDWARATLEAHATDPRPHVYARDALEAAATHDDLWNAAQTQLVREGWFHNYMRMLWGKKILEWSSHPREALDTMIALMNKYALDGRGPNAYTGYFWTLGRYDRPWAPERPIFGTIRYMSSQNTARKLRVKPYLERYGPPAPGSLFP